MVGKQKKKMVERESGEKFMLVEVHKDLAKWKGGTGRRDCDTFI